MVYILLPAYNEEKGIGKVLERIRALALQSSEPFRVVVVDDGSWDHTSEIIASFSDRLDIKLFTFGQNRGVSEVFKTGMRFIAEDSRNPEEDICIVLDSDNTQDPGLIPEMTKKIQAGDDIVIASRFARGGKMVGCPWMRQCFSFVVSGMMQLLIRLPQVRDYSTFYRAYRVRVLKEGFARYGDGLFAGRGFAAIGALLIKLGNVTSRISEIPFILRYDLKAGASGIKLMKTIRGYLELIYEFWKSDGFRRMKPSSFTSVS